MVYREADGGIEIADDPSASPTYVPRDFAHVSSLRWCAERRELLASATPTGAKPPSVSDDERGERRLFAFRLDGGWRQVGTAP